MSKPWYTDNTLSINLPCGKSIKFSPEPKRNDMIIKLHNKTCSLCNLDKNELHGKMVYLKSQTLEHVKSTRHGAYRGEKTDIN
jgi:hypothetical protein